MLRLIFALPSLLLVLGSFAQDKDPAAEALLKKMEENFPVAKGLESTFVFSIQYPEEEPILEKGRMLQKSSYYQVETDSYIFQSDGKYDYVVNKPGKEVYINNKNTSSEEISSPADIMGFYQKGNYTYRLLGEQKEIEKSECIEFKPLDKSSPYFKVKMFLQRNTFQPLRIQLFEKDGTRYTLDIQSLILSPKLDLSIFVFDPKRFSDYLIEDLRIN
jgi:outer membrane lipoprotein-sorting protein